MWKELPITGPEGHEPEEGISGKQGLVKRGGHGAWMVGFEYHFCSLGVPVFLQTHPHSMLVRKSENGKSLEPRFVGRFGKVLGVSCSLPRVTNWVVNDYPTLRSHEVLAFSFCFCSCAQVDCTAKLAFGRKVKLEQWLLIP